MWTMIQKETTMNQNMVHEESAENQNEGTSVHYALVAVFDRLRVEKYILMFHGFIFPFILMRHSIQSET